MAKFNAALKKIYAFILLTVLILAVTVTIFTGCASDGVKKIIIKTPRSNTINSVAHPDVKNSRTLMELASEEFVAQYNKKIKIEVIEFEAGEETKAVSNTFGTKDAADILYDGFFNMSSFIHSGNAVPLDDVLTEAVAKDLNAKYLDDGKFGDKLYMLPYISSQNVLIYNKQLLRQCGLNKYIAEGEWTISSWSIEEWTEILDALAEKLPAGNVPMMMYTKDNQGDTHIMTMLRSHGSDLFGENNNFDIADDPLAVQALKWLQDGADRGWYLPSPYYKTMADHSSKFKMGELAFYNFNLGSSMYKRVTAEGGLDKYGFVNYPGNTCTFFCEGFEVFDNGDAEKVSIAKDFIKYFYATEKWMDCSAGSIPVSNRVLEKYKDSILLLEAFSDNAVNGVDFTRNLPNWQGSANSVRSVFYKEMSKLFLKDANGEFAYTPEECAKSLQDKLNSAVQSGNSDSHPHG